MNKEEVKNDLQSEIIGILGDEFGNGLLIGVDDVKVTFHDDFGIIHLDDGTKVKFKITVDLLPPETGVSY